MHELDELIHLGFSKVALERFDTKSYAVILQYYPQLSQMGYSPADITLLVRNTYSAAYVDTLKSLCLYGLHIQNAWRISKEKLLGLVQFGQTAEILTELATNHGLQAHCTFDEIIASGRPLLFTKLMSHLQQLASLGISKSHLPILMRTHKYSFEITAEKFIADANVLLNQLSLTLHEWLTLCTALDSSNSYIESIIRCHKKLLQIKLLTKAQIVEIGLKKANPSGRVIETLCAHYEKLIELNMLPTDMVTMLYRNLEPKFLEYLSSHVNDIKALNFSSADLCSIWEVGSYGHSIEALLKCKFDLARLGVTTSAQFVMLCRSNTRMDTSVQIVLKHRSQLEAIGVRTADDFTSMVCCSHLDTKLPKLFSEYEFLKTIELTSVVDLIKLLKYEMNEKLDLFKAHYQSLNELTIPNQQIKIAILEEKFEAKSLKAVCDNKKTLKDDWQFNASELLSLIQIASNGQKVILFIVENYVLLKNVSKDKILKIATANLSSVERIKKLKALFDNNLSARVSTATTSQAMQATQMPNEIEQHKVRYAELELVVQTQFIALAELTNANRALEQENAKLKAEMNVLGKKRLLLDNADSDLLPVDAKRAHTSFFKR